MSEQEAEARRWRGIYADIPCEACGGSKLANGCLPFPCPICDGTGKTYIPDRLPAPFMPGDKLICVQTTPRNRRSGWSDFDRAGDIRTVLDSDMDGDMRSVESGNFLFRGEWMHVDGRAWSNPTYGRYSGLPDTHNRWKWRLAKFQRWLRGLR